MRLDLLPIDTWFFRDSTPFDKAEKERAGSPQAGVAGVFPPYPPTVAGAIRVALALRSGWDGRSRWSRDLEEALGDSPENLGRLRITGPFLLHQGEPVFPMPRHVLGCRDGQDGAWRPAAMLRPGTSTVACDLGPSVHLPEVDRKVSPAAAELTQGDGLWITLDDLNQILKGQLPDASHVLAQGDLWSAEFRVGIARQAGSRTTAEGALYSTRHVRLRTGVSLGIEVEGVPDGWTPAGSELPFGGESRLAACEAWQANGFQIGGSLDASGRCVLVALTPLLLDPDVIRGRSDLPLPGACIVAACVGAPLRIGGWDSLRRAPLPLRNAVAPGSTLFCEVKDPNLLRRELHGGTVRLGGGTPAGFGLCAVGTLPAGETRT